LELLKKKKEEYEERREINERALSGEKPNKGVRWEMCCQSDRRRNRRNGPKRV